MSKLSLSKKVIIAGILAVAPTPALADGHGPGSSGGGDYCENRIQEIRDDIRRWILRGGADYLNMPAGLSAGHYKDSMLSEIAKAKIRCDYSPTRIGNTDKVCVFNKTLAGSEFTCNADRLLKGSVDDQYRLVHHEFAGLAGLEQPNGDQSVYGLSDQLSSFLDVKTVKKLSVKPHSLWDTRNQVGEFEFPTKEVISCQFAAFVNHHELMSGEKKFDVSVSNKDKRPATLIVANGYKLVFGSDGEGVSLDVMKSDDPKNDPIATSSTSLGPVKNQRFSKIFLNFVFPGGGNMYADCRYVEYRTLLDDEGRDPRISDNQVKETPAPIVISPAIDSDASAGSAR